MELVTVIIPAYNAEWFVETAIETVAQQSYPNIEIIFVDDHSTDNTVLTAKEKLQRDFTGPWQVIQHEHNKGVSAARNAGLHAAKGAWIQFLDVDDFLAPSKIEYQMKVAESAPEDVAVIYSAWQRAYVEDGELAPFGPVIEPDVVDKPPVILMMNNYSIHLCCQIMRRAAVEKIGGFDETLSLWETRNLRVRLAQSGARFKCAPSREPLYFYRLFQGQTRIDGETARYKAIPMSMIWIKEVQKAVQNQRIGTLPLSPKERSELHDDLFFHARPLHRHDRKAFLQYLEIMRTLIPRDSVPRSPRLLSLLSQAMGYENAEALVTLMRKPKRKIRSMLAGGGA